MRIYTDASTRKISGLGYIATNSRHKVIKRDSVIIDQLDNNTAELQAIIYAIDDTQDLLQENEKVIIFTDSTYAIGAIRGIHCREADLPIVKKIQDLMTYSNYTLFWVKGHCQDGTVLSYFNKKADKLAKGARVEYEKELIKQKRIENFIRQGKRVIHE